MTTELGLTLMIWTIRASVACYLASALLQWRTSRRRAARLQPVLKSTSLSTGEGRGRGDGSSGHGNSRTDSDGISGSSATRALPHRKRGIQIGLDALWAAGFVLCVVHIGLAFHFVHGWSHAAAMEHTAVTTAKVTGLHWGGGLYFNYAFVAWWGIDVALRMMPARRRDVLSRRMAIVRDIVFAFMMFNATVVFGPPVWKWLGAGLALVLVLSTLRDRAFRQER